MPAKTPSTTSPFRLADRQAPGPKPPGPVRPPASGGRRLGRWLLLLVVVLGIGGLLVEVGRRYWLNRAVADQVASHLQESLGAPVQVNDADVGWSSSSLHNLKIYESGVSATPPWVKIQEIQGDIALGDLLKGKVKPRELTVIGAAVTLRFDAQGRLLTHLPRLRVGPGAMPRLHFKNGQITLRQEGRPHDLVIQGIDADLEAGGSQLVLTGISADPRWSGWSLGGLLDQTAGTDTLILRTSRGHLAQVKLEDWPFLPPQVWQQLRVQGDTPVELTLRLNPRVGIMHYRLVLEPKAARLHIKAIDLQMKEAQGKLVIEDGVVMLEGVKGRTAGGTLQADGRLDFRGQPELEIKVKQLNGEMGP